MSSKQKYVVWSGEGEEGHKRVVTCTETGIKRILTAERCGGDRWAYAAESVGGEMDSCPYVRDRSIDY